MLTGKKVNMEGDYQELKVIEEDLENYDVYLTGETHGTELSYKMQEYMARYFIEEQDVRYILLESQVSVAELLNLYLQTGDTEILKKTVKDFEGTFACNQNTYDLYKFYYEYNKQLPDDKKISFVGIDKEHNFLLTAEYLRYLIKDLGEPDEKIKEMVEGIKKYNNSNDKLFFIGLRKSLKENEKEYKEYLGQDFFYFNKAIENTYCENNTDREAMMVKNFQDFYEKLPKGKYYGQFGGAHVYKSIRTEYNGGEDPISTFANSINNDYEPLKGKVYSMIYMYMNSYCSLSGKKDRCGQINIPYFRENGSVRVYTQENNKRAYKIIQDAGGKKEELGDAFFILKDSKAATMFSGE